MTRQQQRLQRERRAALRACAWAVLGLVAVTGLLAMCKYPADQLSRSTPKQVMREHTEAQEAPSVATTLPPMPTEDSPDTVAAIDRCRAAGMAYCDYENHGPNRGGEVIGYRQSPVTTTTQPKVEPTTTTTVAPYQPVPTTVPNPDGDCTSHSADPFSCSAP